MAWHNDKLTRMKKRLEALDDQDDRDINIFFGGDREPNQPEYLPKRPFSTNYKINIFMDGVPFDDWDPSMVGDK